MFVVSSSSGRLFHIRRSEVDGGVFCLIGFVIVSCAECSQKFESSGSNQVAMLRQL